MSEPVLWLVGYLIMMAALGAFGAKRLSIPFSLLPLAVAVWVKWSTDTLPEGTSNQFEVLVFGALSIAFVAGWATFGFSFWVARAVNKRRLTDKMGLK